MTGLLWERPAPPRPFVDSADAEVVVVGAGITGLVTGLLLARAGTDVLVLEADRIGALASGRNTGKVSLVQGTTYSTLLRQHPVEVVRAYADANREGAAWLARFCDDHGTEHGIGHERRDAYTYAASPDQLPALEAEQRAAALAGVRLLRRPRLDLPFATYGAVGMDDQLQLNPLALLDALAAQLEAHGGRIAEGSRVTGASWGRRPSVTTADGRTFTCRRLVIATGSPILDRGLYFAKIEARRSYLLAYRHHAELPGMLLSAGSPTHSLRTVGEDGLLVGGAGHVVGRGRSELAGLDELRAWAAEAFPGAVETHAWSAQDYASHDGIPSVGALPRGFGRIQVATGYDKWGLTNAVAAGLRMTGTLLGSPPSWARPMARRVSGPAELAALLRRNAAVGLIAASRWGRAEASTVSADSAGRVGRAGLDPRPVGVGPGGCQVRAICPHLGGTLRWNEVEHSWDCPLHGSRFAEDGALIEGPATRDLDRL